MLLWRFIACLPTRVRKSRGDGGGCGNRDDGACFHAKAKRHTRPNMTDERASMKGQQFFINVGGPTKHSNLGGKSYVVILVDECTRIKAVTVVTKESDTTAVLLSLIADFIVPQKLSIKCVRTDNGGEFEGEFQYELDRHSNMTEHTPPDTSQHNGVAKRAVRLDGT